MIRLRGELTCQMEKENIVKQNPGEDSPPAAKGEGQRVAGPAAERLCWDGQLLLRSEAKVMLRLKQ